MYIYTYIHACIQSHAYLSVCLSLHIYIHAYLHACLDTCMHAYTHTHACPIQKHSHICLPTNMHTLQTHMILLFLNFCISGISIFLQIRKYVISRNTDIQYTDILYACRHTCMFVCMHVYMYV